MKNEPTNLVRSKCNENEHTFRSFTSLDFGDDASGDELFHGYVGYSRDDGGGLRFGMIPSKEPDGLILSAVKTKPRAFVPALALRSDRQNRSVCHHYFLRV
ncbi:hypothetical protein NFO65_25850 [Neorhizobium galegae]|uniref:hypothetical protein n=1 Tax=Neorhizobium galegae TaxID=399 RepID=UPI0021008594|nr:hypothetical protein [Neorhizobium galegae]MCQ1574160.1 hypothetical protein [Neorhizobium galegae]MCQ1837540.1 hypothetical protein [Neorhizobium galegae]